MSGIRSWFKRLRLEGRAALLPPAEMELVLLKERVRCDRYLQFFSLIVIQYDHALMRESEALLGEFLETRLRLTDEKGFLLKGGIGVLLPMTESSGAYVVVEDLRDFAATHGMELNIEVFTYSGHDGSNPRIPSFDNLNEDSTNSHSPIHCSAIEPDPRERAIVGEESSLTALQLLQEQPIRAAGFASSYQSHQTIEVIADLTSSPFPKWKRAIDIIGASTGLLMSAPIILGSAIAIKLSSRGPVFFRQVRAGQYGKPFTIYKLRTMVVDAEDLKCRLQECNERDGPAFKMKYDPRVTRVGTILRKVGFDELPQLVNVLRGEMSLVGPRPLPLVEDQQCASWHRRRLDTKPGLTCTWQISKSRQMMFDEWMRLDLAYAGKRSLPRDIRLMCKTVIAVFLGRVGH
jgi:lipopolysaccharide/colanic/teichoic acid biosynthesis glycosyltransferase